MNRLVIISLLFCVPFFLVSGQEDIDSLILALDQTQEDTTRMKLLIEISNHFRTSDYDSAIFYLDELIALAEERKDEQSLAIGYYFMANALSDISSVNSAIEYYNRALDLYEEIGDSVGIAKVYNSIGDIHSNEGDYLEALQYFQKSRDIFLALGQEEYLAYISQNIGIAYDMLGDHETARKFLLQALHMLIEADDTNRVFGSAYLNTGQNYEYTNQLDLAFEHYMKGLFILRKLDNRPRLALAYLDIGRYYYLSGQYTMAKAYADSAMFLAEEQNIIFTMLEILKLYTQVFEDMGDYQLALNYSHRYNDMSDRIKEFQINKKLEDFRFGREMAQVEKENAIAMQRVKLTRSFIFWGFILVLFSLIFIYRSYRNKRKANAILAEMDELKSNMFSNISHELRTPLTLILDPIEQMVADEKKKWPSSNTLKSMLRNSHKILGLVNQMLELSKLDAGRLKIDLSKAGIIHHTKVMAASFNSLAEKMEIHYPTKFPEAELEAWFDIDKLDKVLTNLLSNAFKYTPQGGSVSMNVSIRDGKEGRSGIHAEHWLYVSVHDTGKGIPEEDLPKIFNRFYQVGDMDDPGRIGTGIGLALTKELTDLMKGEIIVESKLGHGTHINLSLPLGKKHLEDSDYTIVEARITDNTPHKVHAEVDPDPEAVDFREDLPIIMVVDDNEDIRVHIRDNVTGFNVLEAENGKMGLEIALEAIPDLVITDLRMPVMDGIDLCKKLKEDERTSHIPVIMLTAKSSVESRLEGLETGADDYLTKPFNSKELGLRVQNLVIQRQKLRERYRKEFLLEPTAVTVESADEKFLNRTREIIEEQLSDPELSVEELGKAMAMSRMQLFRKIKSLTDQSPSEYIRTIRLKRAALLIKSDFGNLAEITYEVGFNHPSYFAKCFRELYGVAPSEYGKN